MISRCNFACKYLEFEMLSITLEEKLFILPITGFHQHFFRDFMYRYVILYIFIWFYVVSSFQVVWNFQSSNDALKEELNELL